jgi:hypothetical protein
MRALRFGQVHNHGTGMQWTVGTHRDLAGDLNKAIVNAWIQRKNHHSTSGNNLKITAPTFIPGKISCEYAWVFKIENAL